MAHLGEKRQTAFAPNHSGFMPETTGDADSEELVLTGEEWESIRLADWKGLSYQEAGKRMKISRAVFGQIVRRARRTVADALIHGKALRVEAKAGR
jgi:uncharacterized protein